MYESRYFIDRVKEQPGYKSMTNVFDSRTHEVLSQLDEGRIREEVRGSAHLPLGGIEMYSRWDGEQVHSKMYPRLQGSAGGSSSTTQPSFDGLSKLQ